MKDCHIHLMPRIGPAEPPEVFLKKAADAGIDGGTGKTAAGKKTDDVYIKNTDNVIGAWTTGDDGKVNGWETIGEFSADTQIVGLGDFNANGQADLLLRNVNGAVGCFFTGEDNLVWKYYGSVGSEWSTALAALA